MSVSRVLLSQLTVPHQVKKFPAVYATGRSRACSHYPALCPSPEPHNPIHALPSCFLKINVNFLLYNLRLGLPGVFFPSGLHAKPCAYLSSPETLPTDHSPPSGVEVKNEWSYTFATHIFLHGVDRASFTS